MISWKIVFCANTPNDVRETALRYSLSEIGDIDKPVAQRQEMVSGTLVLLNGL